MSMKLNFDAWAQLLREDVEWLKTTPRTLERDHVLMIIERLADPAMPEALPYYNALPWPEPLP